MAEYLSHKKNLEVLFVEEPDSYAPKSLFPGLKSNQLILLENLRFHPGEEGLDRHFAKRMANYTDIYINEGFGISHKNHTSVTLLPQEIPQRGIGFQFETEIRKLDVIKSHEARKPFLVILGGSKLKDKIPLMEALIDQTDEFFIGGLMAYTFLKALGKSVGSSFVERDFVPKAALFMERLKERDKRIFLPVDHVVENDKGSVEVTNTEDIPEGSVGRDIGHLTLKLLQERVKQARTIFWNGPMGLFEKKEFSHGTQSLGSNFSCK